VGETNSIESFISTLPDELQVLALQVIKEEDERFARGDFTKEERACFEMAEKCGEICGETMDKTIIDAIKGGVRT